MPRIFQNLDANESIFFARELKHITARTFDIRYPEYKATRLLPVSSEAGPGAESVTYRQFDRVGIMKIIANYADDLPRSDVKGVEFTVQVKSLGGSYGFNVQEVRAALMANRPLRTMKAAASRQSWEQEINTIGWLADGSKAFGGMFGILFEPNVTKGAAVNGDWITTATPDEIIEDVNRGINDMRTLTKGVEEPNMVLLPTDEFGHISSTPRSSLSDTTILQFLRNVHPGVEFEWVNELAALDPKPSGGAGPTNVMMIYRRDENKFTFQIPQPYEQFPVQERNLEFVVPTHGRVAGVQVYYPLSVSLIEGI